MCPGGLVRRGSSAVTIQPHSSAAVRLDIPVEVPQIRDDQFSTLVGIVATHRRSGSWMAQLWRGGNANDNVLRVSWAVDPSVYTVRVHVRDLYVRDDCDNGSSDPGEWSFYYGAADRPWPISAIAQLNNPASVEKIGWLGNDLTVYSNRRYEINRTLDLNPVSS